MQRRATVMVIAVATGALRSSSCLRAVSRALPLPLFPHSSSVALTAGGSSSGSSNSRACSMCPRRSSTRAASAGEASAATVTPIAPSPVAPHADAPRSALASTPLSSPAAPSEPSIHASTQVAHATTTAPSASFSTSTVIGSPLTDPAGAVAPSSAVILDSVHLHGMRFFSHHGVYAEETRSGQPFEVDLSLQLDLSAAARADDLSLTVDYGSAHAVVSRLVEGPPHYHLLEALSLRLIVGLLRAFPAVHAVRVTLRKPRVALPGLLSHSAVTMERRRDQLPDLDAIEREHEQRRSKRTQQQQPSST